MPAKIKVTLCCDHPNCTEAVETTATASGKPDAKAHKFEIEVPHDWWVGNERGYGGYVPDTLQCACPTHVSTMRGW